MSLSTKLLAAAALLASACATTPEKPPQSAFPPANGQAAVMTDSRGNKYKVVCKMERPTGSNIAEKVCRPEADNSENTQQLQDQLKNQHTPQFIKSG